MSSTPASGPSQMVQGKAQTGEPSPDASKADEQKADEQKAKTKTPSAGTWVVFDITGKPAQTQSGEVKAMRAAIEIGGRVRWIDHGQPLSLDGR